MPYLILTAEMGSGPQSIKSCKDEDELRKAITPEVVKDFDSGEWAEVVKFETITDWQEYDPLILGPEDNDVIRKLERFIKGGDTAEDDAEEEVSPAR